MNLIQETLNQPYLPKEEAFRMIRMTNYPLKETQLIQTGKQEIGFRNQLTRTYFSVLFSGKYLVLALKTFTTYVKNTIESIFSNTNWIFVILMPQIMCLSSWVLVASWLFT